MTYLPVLLPISTYIHDYIFSTKKMHVTYSQKFGLGLTHLYKPITMKVLEAARKASQTPQLRRLGADRN